MNGGITSVNSAPNLGWFTSTTPHPPQEKMVREPACVFTCVLAPNVSPLHRHAQQVLLGLTQSKSAAF